MSNMIRQIIIFYFVSIASCSVIDQSNLSTQNVADLEYYRAARYIRGTYDHSPYQLEYVVDDEIASEQIEYLPTIQYEPEKTLSRFERQTGSQFVGQQGDQNGRQFGGQQSAQSAGQFGGQQGAQSGGQFGRQQGSQFMGQGRSLGRGYSQGGQGSFQRSSFGGSSQGAFGKGRMQQGQGQQGQGAPGGDNLAIAMGLISQLEPNFQGILYINVV